MTSISRAHSVVCFHFVSRVACRRFGTRHEKNKLAEFMWTYERLCGRRILANGRMANHSHSIAKVPQRPGGLRTAGRHHVGEQGVVLPREENRWNAGISSTIAARPRSWFEAIALTQPTRLKRRSISPISTTFGGRSLLAPEREDCSELGLSQAPAYLESPPLC